MIHFFDQVKENNIFASYGEPLICTDNKINDPKILSSQREEPVGELRRATDSYREQDQWT